MDQVRPVTWWLDAVLSGRIDMHDAPQAVQSWARLPIFEGAREIVLMDTREERQAELRKVPAKIRPYVEREVVRLWAMRRELISE